MVAWFEIVFLIVFVVAGVWSFSRTSTFRAHLRSGVDPSRRPRTDRERQVPSPDAFATFRLRKPRVRPYDEK
jgi:hypothetical protein